MSDFFLCLEKVSVTLTSYFKNLIDQYCHLFQSTLVYVSHYLTDVPLSVEHFFQIEAGRMLG
jgi:hypothetical protein